MANTKGTADNAHLIANKMTSAAIHINEAQKLLREAREAVQEGEKEVDMKLPEFSNLEGLLSIAFATANRTTNTWTDNADARQKRYF